MYKVVTHPANVKHLKAMLKNSRDIHPSIVFFGMEIREDPYLPIDVLSGKFIQPDGRVVEKNGISIKTRWIEYGPEDFDWLMFARIIKEHREPFYIVLDDSKLRQIQSQPFAVNVNMNCGPRDRPTHVDPRGLYFNCRY